MAERYTRLFAAPLNLYVAGSPVILSAAALLKDNKTESVLAQLKIKNISPKRIKAVKVRLSSFDTVGNAIEEDAKKDYLDLLVARDEEFGQKTLIPLPNASTRSFAVTVTEVDFEDNSVWKNDCVFAESLPVPVSLSAWLSDAELVKQFCIKYKDSSIKPARISDLWYCACGAVNHEEEGCCHICGKSIETLLGCDLDELEKEKKRRLTEERAAQEAREAAEKARREAEQAVAKAAAKKRKTIITLILGFAVLCLGLFLLITKVIIPRRNYNAAENLFRDERYEEAMEAFAVLGDYQDSSKRVEDTKAAILARDYATAEDLFKASKYDEAILAFEALGDYQDSAARVEEVNTARIEHENAESYAAAEALFAAKQYEEAIAAFKALHDYKDSTARVEEINTARIEQERAENYAAAEALFETGQYREAIDFFILLDDYKDSAKKLEECRSFLKQQTYNEAVSLKESGEYTKAIEAFSSLLPYKDCERQIELCKVLPFAQAAVGDILLFGRYNQSALLWKVLAREGDSLMLITKSCITDMHFQSNQNNPKYYIDSPIRSFLNNTFLTNAFTDEEQELIETHHLPTTGGDVYDKVFLLSDQEAEKYFQSNADRAASKNWYLRTVNPVILAVLNYSEPIAMQVKYDGEIFQHDWTTDYAEGIRPAIWLNISTYVENAEAN